MCVVGHDDRLVLESESSREFGEINRGSVGGQIICSGYLDFHISKLDENLLPISSIPTVAPLGNRIQQLHPWMIEYQCGMLP